MQFVSNIEHGRAPLPWDKVPQIASVLKIAVEELQAANLAIRSDFKSFVGLPTKPGVVARKTERGSRVAGAASTVAYAAKDAKLREIIALYQAANEQSRKKFLRSAAQMLNH